MIEKNKNLELKQVDISTAQNFWNNSLEGSFFTDPNFLYKLKVNVDYWIVKKGNEELCLWPVNIGPNKIIAPPLFSYYFGPYWSNHISKITQHSKFILSIRVFDLFLNKFEKKYNNIHINLHPNNHDIRYFTWKKNFKDKNKLNIFPKYSAFISELNKKKYSEIFLSFSKLRRRMINKVKKHKNLIRTNFFKLDEIVELYRDTILRKNKYIEKKSLKKSLKKISDFYSIYTEDNKIISLNGFREKKTKKLVSLVMMGHGKNVSNLILNLSDISYQKTGITALTMFDSIKLSKKMKMINFDFNGSNSFIGSDDKHSYGSDYRLYFEIKSESKKGV